MKIFRTFILGGFLLLLFLSRREAVFSEERIPTVLLPFYRLTIFLYHRIFYEVILKNKRYNGENSYSEKVTSYLRILHFGSKPEKKYQEYCLAKMSVCFLIFFMGLTFSLLLSWKEETILKDGNILSRGAFGENEEVTLRVAGERKQSEGILKIKVDARQYTKSELETVYAEFLPLLEKEMLGNNADKNRIQEDMNLVTGIKGFPFVVEWSSSDYELMNTEGKIQKENIAPEGEILKLTGVIECSEFQRIYESFVKVYPPVLSPTEQFLKEVDNALWKSSEKSKYETEWKLPKEAGGEELVWKEEKIERGVFIFGITSVVSVAVFFLRDNDLKKKIKEREQQLLWDYPAVVSRITLYLNAGMTVKAAWKKAAGVQMPGSQGGKKYIQEEMQLTCYEMDSGVPESNAYERFGKRCALQPYIKLTTLLTQNLQKGNRVLLSRLKEETSLALLERKNRIKISAEEAGTKLLVPMMLMMAVVMILIMVPAFNSF